MCPSLRSSPSRRRALGSIAAACCVAVSLAQAQPARDPVAAAVARIDAGDFAGAAAMLQPLARTGHASAARMLGELHYTGRGVRADDGAAFDLFQRAARGGDVPAMFWLGRMHLLGHGPIKDDPDADRKAAQWLFEAARRGHADAQYHLGLLFYAGAGVRKNEQEGSKWIARAAANGHAAARGFTSAASEKPGSP